MNNYPDGMSINDLIHVGEIESPYAFLCSQCESYIFDGEDYYEINGEPWCEECISDCRKVAESYEPDYDDSDD